MSENVNLVSIEDFMGNFGIVPMATSRDEGLLSFDVCKQRILDVIKLNIKNFKEDLWKKENRMMKLLVDLDDKRQKSIFTVRLGGKRIYRCNMQMLDPQQKVEFLTKFYEAVSRGYLDSKIVEFCEIEVDKAKERKKKQKEKRKEKLKAKKAAEEAKKAEAKQHLPQNV